jgi:hypothetical protein
VQNLRILHIKNILIKKSFPGAEYSSRINAMNRGYARVLSDGQSIHAQVKQLRAAGAEKVSRETASGAKTDRAQLRCVLDQLEPADVLMVTRLDRLARSTRDLLNILETIAAKGAGFLSLGDTWADTTTAHRRLMLIVLGGLAEFERDLIRTRTSEGRAIRRGEWCQARAETDTYASPAARSEQARQRWQGNAWRDRAFLQCQPLDDFAAGASWLESKFRSLPV